MMSLLHRLLVAVCVVLVSYTLAIGLDIAAGPGHPYHPSKLPASMLGEPIGP